MSDLRVCPFCASQPRDCYGYDYHKVRCSNDYCIIRDVAMYKDAWNNQQRITELEAQLPQWVSVDERLPEPEVMVLAIVDGYDGILTLERRWEVCDPMIESYYKDFLYWDWVDNDGQDLEGRIRYWMPIQQLKEQGDE